MLERLIQVTKFVGYPDQNCVERLLAHARTRLEDRTVGADCGIRQYLQLPVDDNGRVVGK
jgi:hypothetical protein